jgi:hypothetical protein
MTDQPSLAPLEGIPPSTPAVNDYTSGGALGLLLGVLIGLSTTPVVSTVVTGLVALLAGLFGLSEKISTTPLSVSATRRLTAFGLVATVAVTCGIWLRTHDVLAPSIADQRQLLRSAGFPDESKDQAEMLRFIRFGILPTGGTISPDSPARNGQTVLFALPASFCQNLQTVRDGAPSDILSQLDGSSVTRAIADNIRKMPESSRNSALASAYFYLCLVNY